MIRTRDLRKTYRGGREVLRGIDLEVPEGSLVSIEGRSGSGKTTLLNIVGGLDSSYSGRVEVAGRVLADLDDAELSGLRNSRIGFLFQAYHLLDHLSAAENVMLPSLFARGAGALSSRDARLRAARVLEEVGLGERERSRPAELSGGERQRLALARALFVGPRLLLADEPTGNLDTETGRDVVGLLCRVHAERGATVVVATHDAAISEAADLVLRLEGGQLRGVR